MANKHEVIRLHHEHPDWTAPEIAAVLSCSPGYVRATAQRNNLDLPSALRYTPGEPIAYLRDAQPDAEDPAYVVCAKGDPGCFPVYIRRLK